MKAISRMMYAELLSDKSGVKVANKSNCSKMILHLYQSNSFYSCQANRLLHRNGPEICSCLVLRGYTCKIGIQQY
jgi:hypothetical protein